MKALIVAGEDTPRLHPLTLDRPAALLSVANRPVIEYVLEHLLRHRVTEATILAHDGAQHLETHLDDGTRWGMRLRYARPPLGGARDIAMVADGSTDAVFVAFATALSMADLGRALALHRRRRAALTLLVAPAAGGDALRLDHQDRIVLDGAAMSAAYEFLGLAVLDPRAVSLRAGVPIDLVHGLVPALIRAGAAVHGLVTTEPSAIIRTAGDLRRANFAALGGQLPGLVLPGFEVRDGIRISRGAVVHRSSRLIPPVLVGANAAIGRGATVEATVVGDEVIVGADSTVRNSVLLERTHVGRGLWLDGALVDRDRICRAEAGTWATVRDPRLFGDTRAPLLLSHLAAAVRRRLGTGRAAAPASGGRSAVAAATYPDAASSV